MFNSFNSFLFFFKYRNVILWSLSYAQMVKLALSHKHKPMSSLIIPSSGGFPPLTNKSVSFEWKHLKP